jgi:DNA-binding NtrC family response regulator
MPPVLLVEDRDSLRGMLRAALEAEGFSVEEAADGARAIKALNAGRFLAVVTDLKLHGADGHGVLAAAREADPNLPVIVMAAFGTIEDAVTAMKGGAFDFLPKPVDPDHLVLLLRRAAERTTLLEENLLLKEEFAERLGFPRIIGEAPALVEISRRIHEAAPTDATILVEGESGTGKGLFARAIHYLSPRKDAPFVAVNCAASSGTLIENELFGREKGAYPGAASARAGRIELADRGTLFLDEVGGLGQGAQSKLLRVLQERTFERVGGNRTLSANVRVVAATSRDLKLATERGEFREDLYFRLAAVPLRVPPLRERQGDIPALAAHFLERYRRELGREGLAFSESAIEALRSHDWPGNVRELANCIEHAAILAESERIEPRDLGLAGAVPAEDEIESLCRAVVADGPLDEVACRARDLAETVAIRRALARSEGNKARAARLLEVNYKRFLARIRELGIEDASPP